MSVMLEVWGDYACFSRPALKVERYSYDMLTPSAAIGILEAIMWHPGMKYVIDRIYVLSPIQFVSVRRNEVKSKISAGNVKSAVKKKDLSELYLNTKEDIVQRAAVVLKDVHYVIEAHFDVTSEANASDNAGKFQEMLTRRMRRGQCYHTPYFGTREFPVHFQPWAGGKVVTAYEGQEKDFGIMLHHMEYTPRELSDGSKVYDAAPCFFRAVLRNGILDLTNAEILR